VIKSFIVLAKIIMIINKRTQYPSRVLRPFCVLDMELFSRNKDKIRIMEHTVRGHFFWYNG